MHLALGNALATLALTRAAAPAAARRIEQLQAGEGALEARNQRLQALLTRRAP